MSNNAYHGWRDYDGNTHVLAPEGNDLPLYLDEKNHSPTGFEWGCGGSGPAQLAYAILRHRKANPSKAELFYQEFKREFVANWGDSWALPVSELDAWIEAQVVPTWAKAGIP